MMKNDKLLSKALMALCFTGDYRKFEFTLSDIGKEWYEAGKAIAQSIPYDESAKQFAHRTAYCPICDSQDGIKAEWMKNYEKNDDPPYNHLVCSKCGWPRKGQED